MVQETDCHSHEWVFWANLSTWSKTAVMLGKDFFRNGQNTQFACIFITVRPKFGISYGISGKYSVSITEPKLFFSNFTHFFLLLGEYKFL